MIIDKKVLRIANKSGNITSDITNRKKVIMLRGGVYMPALVEKPEYDISVDSKKQPRFHKSKMRPELLDTPIYNEELLQRTYDGIIQNIRVEMDKENLSIRGLSEISGVHFSHLSNMFSGKCNIGLDALIRLASALQLSPAELFPYDFNKRKTNGQRFDEITKELDLSSSNALLEQCMIICKEMKRLKREGTTTNK